MTAWGWVGVAAGALGLYLVAATLVRVRRLAAQVAVLTMAVKDVAESVEALNEELHRVDEVTR